MPDLDPTDVAVALARLGDRADAADRRLEHIETVVTGLRDLAANAKGGWFALSVAASIGAALASLIGPLLKKIGA